MGIDAKEANQKVEHSWGELWSTMAGKLVPVYYIFDKHDDIEAKVIANAVEERMQELGREQNWSGLEMEISRFLDQKGYYQNTDFMIADEIGGDVSVPADTIKLRDERNRSRFFTPPRETGKKYEELFSMKDEILKKSGVKI